MSVRRHLAWMGASQALFFFFQFVGSVFIARLLSPYELGVYAVAMAVIGVISTVQAFGLAGFVVREPIMTRDLMASAFTINAIISVVLSLVIAGLSVLGGAFLHEAGVRRVMLVLAVMPVLGILEFLPATNLEREANFRVIAAVGTCRTLISQCLAILLAFQGYSYMSLAYGQLAASLFSIIAYNVLGKRHVGFRTSMESWRKITSFGVQMLSISGVATAADRSSEFILGRLDGLGALGLYFRASNLSNLLWENIHLVTGRVLFVDLAATKRAGRSLRESYLKIVDMNTALLWPASSGLAVVSGPFILAVYGPKWTDAAHPLVMLLLALMVYVARPMTWELFVVCDETARQAKIEALRNFVALALFSVGCLFGLTGAAASRVATALLTNAYYRPHVDRMTDTHIGDLIPLYLRNGLLTVVAVLPSTIVMRLHGASEQTPLSLVVASICVGVALWLAAVFGFGHPLADEIRKLANAGFGRSKRLVE